MTLEDFENSLAAQRETSKYHGVDEDHKSKRRKHDHHHHSHSRNEKSHERHKHKHKNRAHDIDGRRRRRSHSQDSLHSAMIKAGSGGGGNKHIGSGLQRDSWMEAPSALNVEIVHRNSRQDKKAASSFMPGSLNTTKKPDGLQDSDQGIAEPQTLDDGSDVCESAQHTVDYSFGDAGTQWRMTKLKAVFRCANETGKPVDEIAIERFGDLRTFDDAREEGIEMERRETYGEDYVGKTKPNGDLFQERKLNMEIRQETSPKTRESIPDQVSASRFRQSDAFQQEVPGAASAPSMDQTALKKLKAQMMKAKLRGSSDAKSLEKGYKEAELRLVNQKDHSIIVLGAMENRMLAGGRNGEVKAVDSKRGRERGKVEENEDMSIDDMVREERRTKGQVGDSSRQIAASIAKDGKFDNDLDYLDENAARLSKRVQRSEINLKSAAVSEFQRMNRILDTCQLCHKDDTNTPPIAPVVSLGMRVFLSLPTEPEISDGGACIVPLQHRTNLLECDDDEWEEIRNFQKSLTRMYHDQGRDVIFYENAASPQRHKHAAMEVVPLPYELGETAPAFFKEAILTTDEEWTQHTKLIDTLAKAQNGMGKTAFKRSLAKEMPYFHVWFTIDGGLGHIIDDSNRWPRGDLFAREIIGGMLDVGPEIIKRQGRWTKGDSQRVNGFRRRWRKFDWTRILTET